MKHLLPLLSCAVLLHLGCDNAGGAAHQNKPQEKHADHDSKEAPHSEEAHDHDEHAHEDHASDEEHGDSHANSPDAEKVVRLSAKALSRSDIRLGEVTRGALSQALEVPAEVALNPDRVAHISPLIQGQLLSVHAALGARVEAQTKLARVRSVELGQARAELGRTSSMRTLAKQNLDRQRKLRQEGISSKRSLLEAKQAYEQTNAEYKAAVSRLRVFGLRGGSGPDMTLKSPISGVIVQRHATRGENVSPADTLFVVADLSRVWVMGRAYEQQISKVVPGMRATLTLSAYPSRTWTGTVDFVGATLDDATRTLPIRVEFDNPDGVLRPGLFGSMRLSAGDAKGAVVVAPRTAIQTLEGQTIVFVPGKQAGEFAGHPVTLGRESGGVVEVLGGLSPGSKVVVEGAFLLKSELMRGELGHGHAH